MKIRLAGVSVWADKGKKRRCVADQVDLTLRTGEKTGFVACRGGDGDLIYSLLSGSTEPDEGIVYREGVVSWPLPKVKFLSPFVTGSAGARFIARLQGVDSDDYIEKILSLADVRKLMGTKMRQWPALQRSEFIAALGMCLDFDFYLFRSPPAGRPEFLEKWNDAIENFSPGKAALIGARHPKDIVDICEQIYILDGNRLLYFPHMEGALEYCSTLSNADFGKRGKTKPLDFEEEEEDADDGAF